MATEDNSDLIDKEEWKLVDMNIMPDFWHARDDISMARQLRLAVVTNVYHSGYITQEQAKELLSGPLSPGDSSTIYDDSMWLKEKQDECK